VPACTGCKQFFYRPDGTQLGIYAGSLGSGSLSKETIPLPGGETAVYNGSGLNFIRHTDWLGSSRLATTWAHAVYSKEAYAPFGETYNEAGTPDRSFTGQDQDVASGSGGTGTYDFLFRKYDPSAGRWLSPDPSGWNAVNASNPQSLNRYAYVMNNPMSAVDLDGLSCYTNWQDGVSVEVDDGDGLGCAAAGVNPASTQDPTGTNDGAISEVVFGGPNAVNDELAFLLGGWELGGLPGTIVYQPNDPFTLSFQGSAGMDAINAKIATNCPAQSGTVAVGTGEAFENTVIDGTAGRAGFFTPEAQLGAFNASYVRDGGTVSITVTNPLSLNSLLFHVPALFGISNPKSGAFSTIHQILQIQEADPCY
jgi:RHS repeat-associated protein